VSLFPSDPFPLSLIFKSNHCASFLHSFATPQDQIDHLKKQAKSDKAEIEDYKSKCENLEDLLRRTESELQDFVETSKEMEAELDAELSASNRKGDDMQKKIEEFKGSVDEWKVS